MWGIGGSILLLVLLLSSQDVGRPGARSSAAAAAALDFTRDDFPQEFVFGAGTSAYQVEGAASEDGRSPSVWDTFTHAGRMPDKSTGDVAADEYRKFKEDVNLMAETGLEAYRFSISWSRLLPNGRGAVNPKGLRYYNNLINELVNKGIQIHISLVHLDLPQILEDEYGGWLSPRIVEDFTAYADVCFREFGDRVRHWTTLVEPNIVAMAGYDSGAFPPNRCSYPYGFNCTVGNSSVEPYIAAHNALLAHSSAARLYRQMYQGIQKGVIGINVYCFWTFPFTNTLADIHAAQRFMDYIVGWILHPVVFGDYPEVMKKNAGSRIPAFTARQSELVKGSADFLGINHYSSIYVSDDSSTPTFGHRDYMADIFATFRTSKNDPPGSEFFPPHMETHPEGLQNMLEYLKGTYGNIPIYVQENGYGQPTNDTIHDVERIDYLTGFMRSTLRSIKNGVNVKGYFVWSFMDVFELLAGYQSRYGLHYVDFKDKERRRQPKLSAYWYSHFLKKKSQAMIESMAFPNSTSLVHQ